MKSRRFGSAVLVVSFLLGNTVSAGALLSGPLLGYRTHRETVIWLETKDAQKVALTYQLSGDPASAKTIVHRAPATTPAGVQPQKFVLPMREIASSYEDFLTIDEVRAFFPLPAHF